MGSGGGVWGGVLLGWMERMGKKESEMNTQSLNYAHSNLVPFHHFQLLENELLYNYRKTNSPCSCVLH